MLGRLPSGWMRLLLVLLLPLLAESLHVRYCQHPRRAPPVASAAPMEDLAAKAAATAAEAMVAEAGAARAAEKLQQLSLVAADCVAKAVAAAEEAAQAKNPWWIRST